MLASLAKERKSGSFFGLYRKMNHISSFFASEASNKLSRYQFFINIIILFANTIG
ncbi:MAG: hypothetical protein U5L45_21995 [Saprospiraceae bacterium]|nr:hypothetical protein [Saprospiraceae bacterium]